MPEAAARRLKASWFVLPAWGLVLVSSYLAATWIGDDLPRSTMVAAAAIAGSALATAVTLTMAAQLGAVKDSRFWTAGATMAWFLFAGEVFDLINRMQPGIMEQTLVALSATAFVISAVFAAMAIWNVAPFRGATATVTGYVLDVLVVDLGIFFVMMSFTLPTVGARAGIVNALLVAVYPSLSLGIAVYVLVFKRTRWEAWHILVVVWATLLGMKDAWVAMTVGGTLSALPGTPEALPADLMLIVAYATGTFAAVHRLHGQGMPATSPFTVRKDDPVWPSLFAPGALLLFGPLVFASGLGFDWTDAQFWAAMSLVTVIGVLTTVRTYGLTRENTSLRKRSTSDPLTGLYNHRYFHERLVAELQRAARDDEPVSLVIMDVDDFDRVNNVHGHSAGDNRLRCIADRLSAGARASDLVCRVGGDEFALVMGDTDSIEAYRICLRLQDMLRECDDSCPLPVSLSAGIASFPEHGATREDLVQKADGALYWAKFHGRENVVIFDPDLVRALGPEERIAMLEEEAYLKMVQLLASAVDARDTYTQRHSRNVANLCVGFSHSIGLDSHHISRIETAALLHDVGKIGIPDALLVKASALTFDEYMQLKEHPALAARILSAIPRPEILPWIASHHERWDGKGYPDGLVGEAIPLEARIIALCDSYDAMTSDRPYRKALTPADAHQEILRCAGTQFDPTLAARFAEFIDQWLAPPADEDAAEKDESESAAEVPGPAAEDAPE